MEKQTVEYDFNDSSDSILDKDKDKDENEKEDNNKLKYLCSEDYKELSSESIEINKESKNKEKNKEQNNDDDDEDNIKHIRIPVKKIY